MSGWVKVPAEWCERDGVEQLGAEGLALYLSALAYSARQLTNGRVPRRALRKLWPVDDLNAALDRLVTLGFWQAIDDEFLIVDWRTFLLASDEVEKRREQTRVSSERYRRHQAGDHSMCERCHAVKRGDPSRDGSRHASVTSSEPNRTEPNRPLGREGGSEVGVGARSAEAPRPPRLQVGDKDPPLGGATPWDVQVNLDPAEYAGHAQITARPILDRTDADDWTETHLDAGDNHFRAHARTIAADLTEAVTDLQARHKCHGQTDAYGMPAECGLSTDHLDGGEPFLSVDVPHELADAWLARTVAAFRAQLADTDHATERRAS